MDRDDTKKQLVMDYQGTFGTTEGRRVLENLSEKCREHVATYVELNPHRSSYLEGMRSVIIYMRIMLAKDPHKEKQTEAIQGKD